MGTKFGRTDRIRIRRRFLSNGLIPYHMGNRSARAGDAFGAPSVPKAFWWLWAPQRTKRGSSTARYGRRGNRVVIDWRADKEGRSNMLKAISLSPAATLLFTQTTIF